MNLMVNNIYGSSENVQIWLIYIVDVDRARKMLYTKKKCLRKKAKIYEKKECFHGCAIFIFTISFVVRVRKKRKKKLRKTKHQNLPMLILSEVTAWLEYNMKRIFFERLKRNTL